MHGPPTAVPEASTQQAGDDHGEQHVERDRAEPDPKRPVGTAERDQRIEPTDRHVSIEHGRGDMNHHERDAEHRDASMHAVDDEARPALRLQPGDVRDSKHNGRRQQHQRNHPGRPGRVPVRERVAGQRRSFKAHDPPETTTELVGAEETNGAVDELVEPELVELRAGQTRTRVEPEMVEPESVGWSRRSGPTSSRIRLRPVR